jgi:hypothetical protein
MAGGRLEGNRARGLIDMEKEKETKESLSFGRGHAKKQSPVD